MAEASGGELSPMPRTWASTEDKSSSIMNFSWIMLLYGDMIILVPYCICIICGTSEQLGRKHGSSLDAAHTAFELTGSRSPHVRASGGAEVI